MLNMIVALLPVLSLSVLVAADANTVLKDLSNLQNELNTLDADVKSVQGGAFGVPSVLQVNVDTLNVDIAIVQTTTDVTNSAKFTADESQSIITALNSITTTANGSITDTINMSGNLAQFQPVVLASLNQLSTDQFSLGVAFASKLDQSVINQGVTDLTTLDDAFKRAIAAYQDPA